jgi:hypothetical protein
MTPTLHVPITTQHVAALIATPRNTIRRQEQQENGRKDNEQAIHRETSLLHVIP